jgi:preprotein translocase subunit SecF
MRFIHLRWLYFSFSLILIVISLISLAFWGFSPSIDFAGGNLWEISFSESTTKQQVVDALGQTDKLLSVQQLDENDYLIKSAHNASDLKLEWERALSNSVGQFVQLRYESLGPSLGKELLTKAITGVFIATFSILLYINLRFKSFKFGVCAILAMFHDSLILLGAFSLLGHFFAIEVDSLFVTAFLTILSFSVHDTVVVYDRIRELSKTHSKALVTDVADMAIEETLVRSINNSMTIIFVLSSLFLLGGESTRWFGLALLIGTVLGTYSSTFTAVPLLVVWEKLASKKRN